MAAGNRLLFSALLLSLAAAGVVSGFQFEVGGRGVGWKKPTGKEPETYNEWAARNRFRIGDSIHFTYENDSVSEVSPADYIHCDASNPITKSDDGDTVFEFQRSGFFYFISGNPEHCQSGQRLIVRVMHPSEEDNAAATVAPSPAHGGRLDSGQLEPPGANSTTKLSAISYFITAFIGLFVIFYMFM